MRRVVVVVGVRGCVSPVNTFSYLFSAYPPPDTACSYLYSFNFSTWIDAEEASLMFRTCVLDKDTGAKH